MEVTRVDGETQLKKQVTERLKGQQAQDSSVYVS